MNLKELNQAANFQLITQDQQLKQVCAQARQQPVVALDTEFVRIRTLYPQLGLIQLYDGEHLSLIDPQQIQDFSPFVQLLADQKVLKVLHACSEDLEVFLHYFQQLPQPMLDTQIMANFLQFPNSTGLASLLQHYFQIEIDKGASRTDWLARPLSDSQLTYAAADVWYLLPLFLRMQQDLAQNPWQAAAEWDCQQLLLKRQQNKLDLDKLYINISNAWRLEPVELARLQLLAKWRYKEAVKRDLALNFVVRAENLWLLAKHNPKNNSSLLELGLKPNEVRIHGKRMLQILEQAKDLSPENYPSPIVRVSDNPRYRNLIKALQQQLKQITPAGLNSEVIASKRSLDSLLKWVWLKNKDSQKLPELMQGWRLEFGEALLQLIEQE